MCGVDAEGSTSYSITGSKSLGTNNTFKKSHFDATSRFDESFSRLDGSSSCTDSQASKTNQLDVKLSELGLYGRHKETEVMINCLDDLVTSGKNKLVYISGLSGTGKTALAVSIADAVAKKNGIFATGKFDQKLRDSPYAGIAAAGRHICGEILHRKKASDQMDFEDIRKTILKNVGSELSTLAMILPEIEDIVGVSSDLLVQDNIAGGDVSATVCWNPIHSYGKRNDISSQFFSTVPTKSA